MTTTAAVRPVPWARDRRSPLTLPAFWLVVALLMAGFGRLAGTLHDAFARYPVATVTAVLLFTAYAVPFWAFVGALDYLEREPPILLTTALAWGGVVATTAALDGGSALHNLTARWVSPAFTASWGPALVGSTIEEVVKLLGIVAIALLAGAHLNSVLDGMVYGATVGLGFQVVENVVYAVEAVTLAGGVDRPDPVVTTFLLRGLLGGLWSHTLFGALAGAGVGWYALRTDRPLPARLAAVALAFAGAWVCHFLWNSPLFTDGTSSGALIGLLIKGVPPLVAILWLAWAARAWEADYYTTHLTALNDPVLVTPAEARALERGMLRARARRYAHRRAGRRGARAVGRLQRAQAGLAVELSRAGGGVGALSATPQTRHWHGEVLLQRRRLISYGHPEATAAMPPR